MLDIENPNMSQLHGSGTPGFGAVSAGILAFLVLLAAVAIWVARHEGLLRRLWARACDATVVDRLVGTTAALTAFVASDLHQIHRKKLVDLKNVAAEFFFALDGVADFVGCCDQDVATGCSRTECIVLSADAADCPAPGRSASRTSSESPTRCHSQNRSIRGGCHGAACGT